MSRVRNIPEIDQSNPVLAELQAMRAENRTLQQQNRAEVQGLRKEVQVLRNDVQVLRNEMQELRTNMTTGFAQVERRMNAAFSAAFVPYHSIFPTKASLMSYTQRK